MPRLILFTTMTSLVLAAPALGFDFSEYRIPRHDWYSMAGSLTFDGARSRGNRGVYGTRGGYWRGPSPEGAKIYSKAAAMPGRVTRSKW
jgi:hypothetical protein